MTKEQIKTEFIKLNLSHEKITCLIEIEEMIHLSIAKNEDEYIVLDCYQDYLEWWIENKATDDCFVIEHEHEDDGYTSTSRTLDTSVDPLNIKDFEEFVRYICELQILQVPLEDGNIYNINLDKLLNDLGFIKLMDLHKVPDDLLMNFHRVLKAGKNIDFYRTASLKNEN